MLVNRKTPRMFFFVTTSPFHGGISEFFDSLGSPFGGSCRRSRLRGEIAALPPAGGKLCEAFGTAVASSGELCYTAEKGGVPMNVTQLVMAYGVEQDRLRALLPEGYRSLRPGAARQRRASAGTSRLCGAEHRRGAGRRPGLAEHRPLERRPGLRRRQNRHLHPPCWRSPSPALALPAADGGKRRRHPLPPGAGGLLRVIPPAGLTGKRR